MTEETLESLQQIKHQIDDVSKLQGALDNHQGSFISATEIIRFIPGLNDQLEDVKVKLFQRIENL